MKDGLNISHNGIKEWWKNGKRHRLDGPAIEWVDGTKEWWIDGQRHRLDGPALIYPDGDKLWWYEGKQLFITSEVINELLEEVLVDDRRWITN